MGNSFSRDRRPSIGMDGKRDAMLWLLTIQNSGMIFSPHLRGPVIELQINGQAVPVDDPSTPLLWVIREQMKLTGTKFGCGIGVCGACTVHLDGTPMRSCVLPASAAVGQAVTTIEVVPPRGRELSVRPRYFGGEWGRIRCAH